MATIQPTIVLFYGGEYEGLARDVAEKFVDSAFAILKYTNLPEVGVYRKKQFLQAVRLFFGETVEFVFILVPFETLKRPWITRLLRLSKTLPWWAWPEFIPVFVGDRSRVQAEFQAVFPTLSGVRTIITQDEKLSQNLIRKIRFLLRRSEVRRQFANSKAIGWDRPLEMMDLGSLLKMVGEARPPTLGVCAYHSNVLVPEAWDRLVAYVFLADAAPQVEEDARLRFYNRSNIGLSAATAIAPVETGTAITAIPDVPGCETNPKRITIRVMEKWHAFEFRIRPRVAPATEFTKGRISFFAGPLLIADADITFQVSPFTGSRDRFRTLGRSYSKIFVSYAHEDEKVVKRLEAAYQALGHEYLRDVQILRSGQSWDNQLLGYIETSNIFQLCWSIHAKASKFVRQEWMKALSLEREEFIRPVYWKKPLPTPPRQLRKLHFAYLGW